MLGQKSVIAAITSIAVILSSIITKANETNNFYLVIKTKLFHYCAIVCCFLSSALHLAKKIIKKNQLLELKAFLGPCGSYICPKISFYWVICSFSYSVIHLYLIIFNISLLFHQMPSNLYCSVLSSMANVMGKVIQALSNRAYYFQYII